MAVFISVSAVFWFYSHGWTVYFGDAEAHLNIARRIVESRHAGYGQLGSPWLPLPHLLMLPFVIWDPLWHTGLAGSIPNAMCFIAASLFLFAAARRLFGTAAGWCAMGLFTLNPNALYLQSIPMTEAIFFATLLGLLFHTMRYKETQSVRDLMFGAMLCIAASLTRYDGWVLIPCATLYTFFVTRERRWRRAAMFASVAAIGPLCWFLYNWWIMGGVLYFYNGPGSALAIQRGIEYPGHGNWRLAFQYYWTAATLNCGWPLMWIGCVGLVAALFRRAVWPVILLSLPPLFYVWNIHSSASPIHVPVLPPFSWYNTRYALTMLPLLAWGGAALVFRARGVLLAGVLICGSGFWLIHRSPDDWITWKESERNSIARREWTHRTAAYLASHAKESDTFFTTFGDITGVYREAGIHLSRTLTWNEFPEWQAAVNRPDLFLWEDWAVAQRGDPVDVTARGGPYELVAEIAVADAAPIEIYHRHEHSIH